LGSGGWNVEDTKGKIFVTYRQTDIGLLPAVKLKPELQMSLEVGPGQSAPETGQPQWGRLCSFTHCETKRSTKPWRFLRGIWSTGLPSPMAATSLFMRSSSSGIGWQK